MKLSMSIKLFAVFMALVGAFMAYFCVTVMYFPSLAIQFDPLWEEFGGKYSNLDLIIWTTLGMLGYFGLIIGIGEHHLVTGITGTVCNLAVCIVWQQMEIGNLPLGLAIFCLVIIAVYNLITSVYFLFTKNHAINTLSEPTASV